MKAFRMKQKEFAEEGFAVSYWLLSQITEVGEIYGIRLEKIQEGAVVEEDEVQGISLQKEDVALFLKELYEGSAVPVELVSLCDDFLLAKEWQGEYGMAS